MGVYRRHVPEIIMEDTAMSRIRMSNNEMPIDDFLSRMWEIAKGKKMNAKAIADGAKLKESTISKWSSGAGDITFSSIVKVCRALEISVGAFFNDSRFGIRKPDGLKKEIDDLYQTLSDDQIREWLKYGHYIAVENKQL